MKRREFLSTVAGAGIVAASPIAISAQNSTGGAARKGRLKQSVMSSVWGNSQLSFEERCKVLARIGFKGVDLPQANQVPILKANGLAPALMTGGGTNFQNGLIRKEMHDKFVDEFHKSIDTCVEVGCPTLIAIPGEKRGMSPEEAADNAAAILSRVKGYAEQKGITLCMEITNSKVVADQRTDQAFNHLAWGWDVCKKVNSPRVKVLFDCYHVQIMDGDLVRNIRDNFDRIAHFHVAGVPTRNEIDENTNEVNYRFVANAIADLGYTGFIAHEYRPSMGRDPIKDLEAAFEILNV